MSTDTAVHSSYCILCIDDSEAVLRMLRAYLEAWGYAVLTATDGIQGMKLLTRNVVDVLVLDYEISGMNGEPVARKVRRLRPDLPIVVFSGHSKEECSSLLRLANTYVPKGGTLAHLCDAVVNLLPAPAKHVHSQMLPKIAEHDREPGEEPEIHALHNKFAGMMLYTDLLIGYSGATPDVRRYARKLQHALRTCSLLVAQLQRQCQTDLSLAARRDPAPPSGMKSGLQGQGERAGATSPTKRGRSSPSTG